MNIEITLISLVLSFFLVGLVIFYFLVRQQRLKNELLQKELQNKHNRYQLAILTSIQKHINYSLQVEEVFDTILQSLQNIFSYTTASFLVLDEDKLIFKIQIQEKIGNTFVDQIKESMIASLALLIDRPVPKAIDETRTGILDDIGMSSKTPGSLFHIPFVVNNKVLGILTITASKANLYTQEEMMLVYQSVNQSAEVISRVRSVVQTEKEKLNSLIISLKDGIFMIDASYKVSIINTQARNLLDIQKEHLSIFDIVSALSQNFDLNSKIDEALSQRKTIIQKELELGTKTIEIIITPVLESLSVDTTDKPPVIGAAVLLHDITLEKSLSKLKEDFTHDIVHELRSPLSAIKAASEVIEHDESTCLKPEDSKLLHVIDEQAKRMLSDISTLLDAAKMENGKYTVTKEPYDIAKIIEDTKALFVSEAEEKKVKIVTDIEAPLQKASLDPLRMSQVLNNLISNSLKYTPEGGTITISAKQNINDHLPTTGTNPGILLAVADTGVGIPKEKQGLLFSKFGQAHSDTEQGKKGTGLGLFISKGIVEAHGGSIFLESQENKGTKISFTLRIAEDQKSEKPESKLQNALPHFYGSSMVN